MERRLDPHPTPEVGQRIADRRLHGVERLSADAVGEQRRVERRLPASPAVHRVRLTLDGVHRRGDGHLDRGPRPHLGVVGGSTDFGSGVGGETAHGGHRQRRRSVWQGDLDRQLRRDVALQPAPRPRSGGRQLGVQVFLDLRHLVVGAVREPAERAEVLGRLVAHPGERCRRQGPAPSRTGGRGAVASPRRRVRARSSAPVPVRHGSWSTPSRGCSPRRCRSRQRRG